MKQVSAATFQGYLREDQEFQRLRDVEALNWQADVYEELVYAPVLGGRAGKAIMQAGIKQKRPVPPMLSRAGDDARVDEIERAVRRGKLVVFKTRYGHCLFDRQSARCLDTSSADKNDRPKTHACQPVSCANCCVTPSDVPAWQEDISEYEAIKMMPDATPGQIETCDQEIAILKAAISPLLEAGVD
jgi:hypothetical protein